VTDVDVLVVGAGPAGSAAAYHLARAGAGVLLVDRARFPRDKVCGDGLTPRAVGALIRMGVDIAAPGFEQVRASRTRGARGRSLDIGWPSGPFPDFGLVRKRSELDHLLLGRAAAAGAVIREATEAGAPLVRDGRVTGVTVRPAGADDGEGSWETVGARFVVAADGVSGRTATLAGLARDASAPLAVAARAYYRVEPPVDPVFDVSIGIDDRGRWLPGYGWVFPTGDGEANVGAFVIRGPRRVPGGGRRSSDAGDVSARAAFDAFLAGLPPERRAAFAEGHATSPVRSSAIPMGLDRTPAMPGMLVVGDAAGLANPFTGEGIGYAMESGELAAKMIVEALGGGPEPAGAYAAELHRRHGRTFRAGRWFAKQICRPGVTRLAARYGTRIPVASPAAIRFMIDAG
jgi:geranylgeranyl reductase family protein